MFTCCVNSFEIIGHSHLWDNQIKRLLMSPAGKERLWDMAAADGAVREALSGLFCSSESHFDPVKKIFEKVFGKMRSELESIVEPYRKIINGRMETLVEPGSALNDMINYSIISPGKRLRSSIVLIMVETFDGDREKALPAALSYELAHIASLVHDDVIDSAEIRWARQTVLRRFGMDGAIVSGDALILMAFDMLRAYGQTDISRDDLLDTILCATASGIRACRGELLDVAMGKNLEECSIEDYIKLVRQKTAALIEAPCEAGAILAGQPRWRPAAAEFGLNLGIAFQILDDSKDIFASESSSLKGRYNDLKNNKPNLYIIGLLHKARGKDRVRLKALLQNGSPEDEDVRFLYSLCESTGVLNHSKQLCRDYLGRADRISDDFPEGNGKETLKKIISTMGIWSDM